MLADFAERLTQELVGSRAATTLQVYRSPIQHLRDFEKYSRRRYDFAGINLEFYNKFTDCLITKKAHSPNTVGKVIKTLKSFLTEAAERKLHTTLDYKSKKFKAEKEETEAVYFTVPELTTSTYPPAPLWPTCAIFSCSARSPACASPTWPNFPRPRSAASRARKP